MALDLFGPSVNAGGVTVRPADTRVLALLDTWFKDCSAPGVEDGTEDQAAWRNGILAMLRAVARGNGQTGGAVDIVTESNVNDSILLTAIKYLVQRQVENYADDSGAANVLTLSLTPALSEYKKGFRVWTQVLNRTTGACTVNINGLGAKNIKTVNGANPAAGALAAGQMACLEYDGVNFQIISTLGAEAFSLPKCVVTLAAIGALAFNTQSIHGMTVASHSDLGVAGPTISGGNAIVLPAGTYSFQINSTVTIQVNNITQAAMHTRLLKNGAQVQVSQETTHLLAGQNVTVYPGFSGTVSVNGTDTIQVAEFEGTTVVGDFNSGNSAAGTISFQRIGA